MTKLWIGIFVTSFMTYPMCELQVCYSYPSLVHACILVSKYGFSGIFHAVHTILVTLFHILMYMSSLACTHSLNWFWREREITFKTRLGSVWTGWLVGLGWVYLDYVCLARVSLHECIIIYLVWYVQLLQTMNKFSKFLINKTVWRR